MEHGNDFTIFRPRVTFSLTARDLNCTKTVGSTFTECAGVTL